MFAKDQLASLRVPVHRQPPESSRAAPGRIALDLASFVQQQAAEVIASFPRPEAATLHFIGEMGCRVEASRARLLGRVVAEFVGNALKYAHPTGIHGKIEIRCRRLSAGCLIEVVDDGVGLPEGFDPMREGSGFRRVRELAEQAGGSVSFESDGLGFVCKVWAPVLAPVPSEDVT